jgi:hypothetical protein
MNNQIKNTPSSQIIRNNTSVHNSNLLKLIDNLKSKIKKLNNETKNISQSSNSVMMSYKISTPNINNQNYKKYTGLLFTSNTTGKNISETISWIKLSKSNNVINFSISLKINGKISNMDDSICSFSLGIKDVGNKIKIIKGSKIQSDIKNSVDNNIIINNTILYESLENQELCLIAKINKNCSIISKKSIIKILVL